MTEALHIKNELGELAKLNAFVEHIGSACHLSESLLMQFKLAVEETVTNVILYAYPGEKEKNIEILLTCENDELIVQITDSGIAFNPIEKADPDLTLPADERPIGGLGIYLAKQLMTQIQYRRSNNKNIVTMRKQIL